MTLSYDDAGQLTEAHGRRGGIPVALTVERSTEGDLQALLGIGETRAGAALDAEGRLGGVVRPDGTVLYVTFRDFGLVANWQATGRGAVAYEWDAAGRLTKETDADGVTRELVFASPEGAVTVSATDANGATATFRSERATDGLRRTFTDVDGTVTQLDTSSAGSTRYVEPDGTVTTTGAVAHPVWGQASPVLTPLIETRPDGTEYRVETATTMGAGMPEPAGGAWRTEHTINGQRYVDEYDPATRTATSIDPVGRASSQVFDEQGRLVEHSVAGEPRLAFTYDAAGLVGSVTVGEGGSAATTTYSYVPEAGEVIETRPDGVTVTFTYDAYGNLRRASTASENVSLTQDAAGAALQVRAGAHPATSIGYSEAGRETAYLPVAVGDDSSYETTTYTPAGQVASINGPGQRHIQISYDAAGRALSWNFDRGTSRASYGAQNGLIESNKSPDGVTTSFAYDGWVPLGLAWSGPVDGDVRLTVDGQLRPTAESVNGSNQLEFGYDDAGLLTGIDSLAIERDPATGLAVQSSLGNVATAYEYDANGLLTATVATTSGEPVLGVRYSRDIMAA